MHSYLLSCAAVGLLFFQTDISSEKDIWMVELKQRKDTGAPDTNSVKSL